MTGWAQPLELNFFAALVAGGSLKISRSISL